MARKIYIKNGVNLDSASIVPGYKAIGYNSESLSNLSEKNDLGVIREIGGGGGSSSVAPGNGVTASGTINYISKFTDTNILGDSIIYDDGTNVGIGTASSNNKLHVYDGSGGPLRVSSDIPGDYIHIRNNDDLTYIDGQQISIPFEYGSLAVNKISSTYFSGLTPLESDFALDFYGFNKGDLNRLVTMRGTGDVGINKSSPTARLHIKSMGYTPGYYALKIDNSQNSPLLYIRNDGNVGIGLTAPSTKLHVYGTQSGAFRLVDTTEGLNKVLTSDANGVGTWVTASTVSGNGVTASGTTNSVSMFTGTNTLGNSIISQPNDYTLNMYANNNTSSFNMYNANVLKTTLDFSNPNSVFSLTSVGGIDFNSGYGGTINLLTSYADIVAHGYRGKVVLKITDTSSVEHVATLANNGNFGIGTASPNSKLHVYDGNIELSLGRGLLYNGYTTFTTDSFNGSSLLIGRGATGTSQVGEGYIALGFNSHSTEMGIAIGISSNVNNGTYDGIAIGRSSTVNGGLVRGVAIGRNATALHTNSWALGYNAVTTQDNEFNFGVSGTLHKYIFNGQVGIGTSSPTTYLHINATQSGAGFRLVDTSEGLNKVLTSDANGVGTWASIGSIGIGTTNKSVDTRGFTASVTETITHNLNSNSVIVQNYDSTGLQVIAGSVQIIGTGSVDITFSQTLSNVKTIIIG